MARIAGIDIPGNKRIEIALTYVFGIGRQTSRKILTQAGIDFDRRAKDIPEEELDKVRKIIDADYTVEGNLRSTVRSNIKRLMDIGCYRGLRHRRNLPCRGQRTKTNARTRKGPRKTVANKKKATK